MQAYYRLQGNSEGGMPDDLRNMEPHVAALVRFLNDLGLPTHYSCEGHAQRRQGQVRPTIGLVNRNFSCTPEAAAVLQLAFGATGSKLTCRVSNSYIQISFNPLYITRLRQQRVEMGDQVIIWAYLLEAVELMLMKKEYFKNLLPSLRNILTKE